MSQETRDVTVKKEGNLPAELNFIQDACKSHFQKGRITLIFNVIAFSTQQTSLPQPC